MSDKPVSELARERKLDRAVRSVAEWTFHPSDVIPGLRMWGTTAFKPHPSTVERIRQAFNTDKG